MKLNTRHVMEMLVVAEKMIMIVDIKQLLVAKMKMMKKVLIKEMIQMKKVNLIKIIRITIKTNK
jgi:hypothetical protein